LTRRYLPSGAVDEAFVNLADTTCLAEPQEVSLAVGTLRLGMNDDRRGRARSLVG